MNKDQLTIISMVLIVCMSEFL